MVFLLNSIIPSSSLRSRLIRLSERCNVHKVPRSSTSDTRCINLHNTGKSCTKYVPLSCNLPSTSGALKGSSQDVSYDLSTAVTMDNAQFVLHRRHITSPLHSPAG
jgi:hypothetical protein